MEEYLPGDILEVIKSHVAATFESLGLACFSLVLVPVYVLADRKQRDPWTAVLFWQRLGVLFCYTVNLWYFKNETDAFRYALIPYLFWGAVGFWAVGEGVAKIVAQKNTAQWLLGVVLVIAVVWQLRMTVVNFLTLFTAADSRFNLSYIADRHDAVQWIREHAGPEDLIASEFNQDSCVYDRPVIALPRGLASSEKNFDDLIRIYRPRFFIVNSRFLIKYLIRQGFELQFHRGGIFILENLTAGKANTLKTAQEGRHE